MRKLEQYLTVKEFRRRL